jgi:hypothetical protein
MFVAGGGQAHSLGSMATDSGVTAMIPGMTTPAALSSGYAADPMLIDHTLIEQLRIEAASTGDGDLIALCDLALSGDRMAIWRCGSIIAVANRFASDDPEVISAEIRAIVLEVQS